MKKESDCCCTCKVVRNSNSFILVILLLVPTLLSTHSEDGDTQLWLVQPFSSEQAGSEADHSPSYWDRTAMRPCAESLDEDANLTGDDNRLCVAGLPVEGIARGAAGPAGRAVRHARAVADGSVVNLDF